MHPHYHAAAHRSRPEQAGERHQLATSVYEEYAQEPGRLVADAMSNWRSVQTKLTSVVDDLVDDERDAYPISQYARRSSLGSDEAKTRWTVERQHEAEDAQNVAELADELGIPSLRLGLNHRDDPHPFFGPPRFPTAQRDASVVVKDESAPPRPWVSIDRLVANRIREELDTQREQLDHETEYVHARVGGGSNDTLRSRRYSSR